MRYSIRDDFAGPGGWDQGLVILKQRADDEAAKLWTMYGIENDRHAADTAIMAGHCRIRADVRHESPNNWRYLGGYIASPPCQTFSPAGNGEGRRHLDALIRAAQLVAFHGQLPADAVGQVSDAALDERSVLVLEPLRVIVATRPRWIALEQVKTVQPIWNAYAAILTELGYHVRTEVVHAEQYGVPQTRQRAILIAVRMDVAVIAGLGSVPWPTPTHSRYYPRDPSRLDAGVLPWVSMAEALSFGMTHRPSMTVTGGGTATGGAEPFANGARKGMKREIEAGNWRFGDVRSSRGTLRDSVRITVEQAGVLQTFRPDYPWQGTQGQQFQQVGNAVPVRLAAAFLEGMVKL